MDEKATTEKSSAGNPELFVNRELSWLEFDRRVLLESENAETPVFERLKFEAIYFNNLDEFFMVRIGSLSDQAQVAPDKRDEKTGQTADEQISAAFEKIRHLQGITQRCWRGLVGDLASQAGVDFLDPDNATHPQERALISRRFKESVRLLLSPLIIDHHHPFPFLRNREQYVVSLLEGKNGKTVVGIVPLGLLPSFSVFDVDGRKKILFTADLVRHFSKKIFTEHKVRESTVCRATRNADIPVDESLLDYSDAADFRDVMQEMLKKRRRLAVVRLQFLGKPSAELVEAICHPLKISTAECLFESVPLDFSFGFSLAKTLGLANAPGLSATPLPASVPVEFRGNAAETIRKKDLLLAYPFHSMKPFVQLLEEAADDPEVLSIRITLYRMCSHSKIAMALARAAENGKEVLCVLELRARFDEQNNINYAEILEKSGCTVIYGLPSFKVHAKLCLITYRSAAGTQTITQIGTGNYNEKTAAQYTDLCLITADPAVGRDAAKTFTALGMGNVPRNLETLWVAPNAFLDNLIREIDEEILAKQSGNDDVGIAIKVNGLNNIAVMRKLAEASQAGVPVELFVRGICCLRPGIAGKTERVSVRSIVGTYLEHSRIFAFGKNARERVRIGSGDLMNRNLIRRVEAFVPVNDPAAKAEVLGILDALRRDNKNAWEMLPDGRYCKPPHATSALPPYQSQLSLHEHFAATAAARNASRKNATPPGARSRDGVKNFFSRLAATLFS